MMTLMCPLIEQARCLGYAQGGAVGGWEFGRLLLDYIEPEATT